MTSKRDHKVTNIRVIEAEQGKGAYAADCTCREWATFGCRTPHEVRKEHREHVKEVTSR